MSTIQSIDYLALAPVLVLALGSVLVLVVDLLVARGPAVPGWLALAVVVSAAALVPASAQRSTLCVAGAAAEPGRAAATVTLGPTLAFQGIALAATGVVVLLAVSVVARPGPARRGVLLPGAGVRVRRRGASLPPATWSR